MIISSSPGTSRSAPDFNSKPNPKPNPKPKAQKLESKINIEEFKKIETEESVVTLRPKKLAEVVGQKNIVRQLQTIIDSSLIRDKMPDHILFYGQPGLGKTTLSNLIATEIGANFKVISAPSLQKVGDMVGLLVGIEPKTVLFIDEIHRLKAPLEETLYSAMEDFKVDLLMGKGNGTGLLTMDVNSFVLVGATTQLGKLSKPLKDRFTSVFQLETYSYGELFELVSRSCEILGVIANDKAKRMICERSRGVPRVANNILKRLLDFQLVKNIPVVDERFLDSFFADLGIFDRGLTSLDIAYLKALQDGVMGLKTIASMLMEDIETIELVVEPYLLYLGYISKGSSGRSLTSKGKVVLIS